MPLAFVLLAYPAFMISTLSIFLGIHLEFQQFLPTCQVVVGPPAQLTSLAGELVLNILVVLAGSADPAAAHLTLPDHLHTTQPRQQRW